MALQIRFLSLSGTLSVVRTETFATTMDAETAVKAHAEKDGYRDVRLVDESCGEGFRFTATTPGGRKGRNVATGDYGDDYLDEDRTVQS